MSGLDGYWKPVEAADEGLKSVGCLKRRCWRGEIHGSGGNQERVDETRNISFRFAFAESVVGGPWSKFQLAGPADSPLACCHGMAAGTICVKSGE